MSLPKTDVTNVGALKGLIAIILGKQHTTRLFFSSLEDEYTQWLLAFESIINSFSYDGAYAYDPTEAVKNDSSSVSEGVAEKGLSGAITGVIIGLLATLLGWSLKKKKVNDIPK